MGFKGLICGELTVVLEKEKPSAECDLYIWTDRAAFQNIIGDLDALGEDESYTRYLTVGFRACTVLQSAPLLRWSGYKYKVILSD